MGILFFIALIVVLAIIIFNKKKNSINNEKRNSQADNEILTVNKELSQQTKVDNPRSKSSIDPTLKNILIFGGIGCVIVAIVLCVIAENTKNYDVVGIGFIAVLAVIAIGSMSSKKNSKQIGKNYFIDEVNRIHSPGDLDFEAELIRYSEYNENIYHKPISIVERNYYIIDGKGNKVDIRSKRFYMRDSKNELCYIKMI